MKQRAILLLIVLFSFACKKEKGAGIPAQGVLTTGTWYVSKFMDSGTDETYIFEEYTFVFNTNGELTATCIYGTTIGSWYAEDDDDGTDEFRIALGNVAPLDKLSKRWHIRSESSTEVEFYDDDNSDEEVTFMKR